MLGVTANVGTVVTAGGVTRDTGTVNLTTDVVEDVLVVVSVGVVLDDTGQGVLHTLTDVVVRGRRQASCSHPVGAHGRTGGDGGVGGGRWVDGLGREGHGLELGLQVVEVVQGGDGVVRVDRHQTVVVLLFKVHVDNSTGPDIGHLAGVDGTDFLELSWLDSVTTVLGEEDWNAQLRVLLGDGQVTGLLERRGAAPFVHVDTEEVGSLVLVTASKVVSQVDSDVGVIVGRVTDRNRSVLLLLDVGLGVSDGSLNVGGSVSVGNLVGDFVTGKETQDVGVVVESVDDGGVSLQQLDVPLRVGSVDRGVRLGQVSNDVDSGVIQHLHTFSVVQGGVQGVHSDDVCVQLLQVRDISLTSFDVAQWVDEASRGGCVFWV